MDPPGRVAAVARESGEAVFYKPGHMVYLRCHAGWLLVRRLTLPFKSTIAAAQFANAFSGHMLKEKKIRFTNISSAPATV